MTFLSTAYAIDKNGSMMVCECVSVNGYNWGHS